MTARFHLIRKNAIVGTVEAESKREAERLLGWTMREGDQSYVVSAASWALGMPRPLPSDRCTSCGQRTKKIGYQSCEHCILRDRREAARARLLQGEGAPAPRPVVTVIAGRTPAKLRVTSGRTSERHRQANIRRGVEQRAAKRAGGQ